VTYLPEPLAQSWLRDKSVGVWSKYVLCLVLLLQSLAFGYKLPGLVQFEATFSVKIILVLVYFSCSICKAVRVS